MKATAAAIRGGVMGWGKLQRRGLNSFSAGGANRRLADTGM